MSTSLQLRSSESEFTGPPREWFFGEEWLQRDIAAVFDPRWLVAAHVDQLIAPGSAVSMTLGSRVCEVRRTAGGDYIATELGSGRRLHAEVWVGFVFVSFATERPASLADELDKSGLGGYDTTRFKLAAFKTHEVEANWKIVFENNNECYHCELNHPELVTQIDWKVTEAADFDQYMLDRAAGREIETSNKIGSYSTLNNEPVSQRLLARQPGIGPANGSWTVFWEPGSGLAFAPDHAWMQAPRPTGAGTTQVDQYWLVDVDAVEGVDYDLENLKFFWDTTLVQDKHLCESVQKGMRNPVYQAGPLNRRFQGGNAGFYSWYGAQVKATYPELF
ncbi:SRPBCC family protein [Microbacterium atlanticum]|uniref:SRPBCC family protein n=1 Tax=Microbacterium atlanticum TaxID=2782168 RepID=UPI001887FB1C|nr:SRPBCC family protein [Microbacterium atlanticum]